MENQMDRILIGRPGDTQKSHWKVETVKWRRPASIMEPHTVWETHGKTQLIPAYHSSALWRVFSVNLESSPQKVVLRATVFGTTKVAASPVTRPVRPNYPKQTSILMIAPLSSRYLCERATVCLSPGQAEVQTLPGTGVRVQSSGCQLL
ncbi:hypothetical protein AMECASPLE_035371 [Ameca splendens]|uniref:Uncharacterized protein n=1 Tax=Ameca splendens TaxID=208324 RepID=A0ABV0Z5S1_9TELE